MIFYSKFKGKTVADRAAVLFLLIYCLLNVLSHTIVQLAGGVGNIAVIYVLTFYFVFFYGVETENRKVRIHFISFAVFLAVYVICMQFVYRKAGFYTVFGLNFETHVWNLVSFVPVTVCAVCMALKTDGKQALWIRRVLIFVLLATIVPSMFMLARYPGLAKQTATGRGKYVPFLINYAVVYGLAVILPYFFLVNRDRRKIWQYAMGILVFACICFSSFFIAIVAAVFGVLVCLVLKVKNVLLRRSLILLALICAAVFVFSGAAYNVLIFVAARVPSKLIAARASQLALFLRTGSTGDATVRIDMYRRALRLVARHPVMGSVIWEDVQLSGHSEFLDVWGGSGIVALLGLIFFFASLYKANTGFLKTAGHFAALKASTLVLLFVSLTNPVFSSPAICLLWIIAPMVFTGAETESVAS